MSKLTDDQVEMAVKIIFGNKYIDSKGLSSGIKIKANLVGVIRDIAPHLQMTWEEPLMDEVNVIERNIPRHAPPCDQLMRALSFFVNLRNAALLPKPVDSRRNKLRKILTSILTNPDYIEPAIHDILASLDEVSHG